MGFAIVILIAALSQKTQPDRKSPPQPQGKEFILEKSDAPMIDTIVSCDATVIYGKYSKKIREIFPEECEPKAKEQHDSLPK